MVIVSCSPFVSQTLNNHKYTLLCLCTSLFFWIFMWLEHSMHSFVSGRPFVLSVLLFLFYCSVVFREPLFVLSPVSAHLGGFHLLVVVKSAAVHIHVQVFARACFHFSWRGTEEWDCWVVYWPCVWLNKKLPNYCKKWLHNPTFLLAIYGCFSFSTSFWTLVILCLFKKLWL